MDWAIIGYRIRWFHNNRFISFAGGRSRQKLERIATRMNGTGDYRVSVRWIAVLSHAP